MAVQFRVNFGTFHGTQGNYRLDISNEAYSGPIQTTISDDEVINIQYTKDYDDYSPIISSTASVVLIDNATTTYPRFSNDINQTWKVEMLVEDPDNLGNYLVYWAGWVVSESFEEEIRTDPVYISFQATDGLGDLSRLDIAPATVETERSLISYIQEGLRRTNLGLDVYYNSGLIAHGTLDEYLDQATVHPYAFYKDDLTERCKELARITTILQGLNCRIFQSYGKWYITSWSDYEGTISGDSRQENIEFKVRNNAGVAQTNVTENVRYEIKRSSGTNVDLINTDDLKNEVRDPFFSVTQQIDNYTLAAINANPLFELGATGYVWPNTTYPEDVQSDVVLNGTNAVRITHNAVDDNSSTEDRVFFTTPVPPPSFGSGYNINFSWRSDFIANNVTTAEIRYRIVIEYDNNTAGFIFSNTDYAVWNFERSLWHHEDVTPRDDGFDAEFIGRAQSSSSGEWNDVEVQVPGSFGLGDNPRLFIEIYTPVALLGNSNVLTVTGGRTAQTGLITSYVDNVRITPDVAFESAHFERNQPTSTNYTKEYVTQTAITTRGEDIFYNQLSRTVVGRARITNEMLSLEEIVTQQRLNDYRTNGNFYRGTFVNNAPLPLGMHHKPLVTYSGRSEIRGGILDEIEFSAKNNLVSTLFRIPDQTSDVASTFNEFDVHPQIIDRELSPIRSLTLQFETIGLDDTNNPITFDNAGTTENVISPSVETFEFRGLPGETSSYKLIIGNNPASTDQYELAASNWMQTETLPDYVTLMGITQVGRNLEAEISITIPHRTNNVMLSFTGEADPFIADNRSYDLTFALASGVDNAMITSTTRALRGRVGDVVFANVIISPSAGHQLDATTFVTVGTLPTGVQLLGTSQLGTSVLKEYAVTIQGTNQAATITLTGDDGTVIPATGFNTSTVTINFVESITNVSINRTQLVVSGFVGQRSEYNLVARAADGFLVDADNFSAVENVAWLAMGDAYGAVDTSGNDIGGESVTIPFQITFPAVDSTTSVTINGSAQQIGVPTRNVTVNFTGVPSNTSLTETTETFTLNPGQSINYVNTLTPNQGYQLGETGLTLTETDPNNVISGLTSNQSKFQANISMTITAGAANSTATIALSGAAAEEEPYQHVINLTESLPNGKLNTTSMSSRFGDTDTSVVYSITISPVDEAFNYPTTTTFTVVGGTASNYTYSGGSVTFTLTVALPSFSSTNPIGDVSANISITGVRPTEQPATLSEQNPRVLTLDNRSQEFGVSMTANGTWGVDQDSPSILTITSIENEGRRGGTFRIRIGANTGSTARSETIRITNGSTPATIIGGITVTQQPASTGLGNANQISGMQVRIVNNGTGGAAGFITFERE